MGITSVEDTAWIGALTDLLKNERVVFIGLGGIGAYVLDLVAKAPVPEIRLIDGEDFLTHNAFRVFELGMCEFESSQVSQPVRRPGTLPR